MAMQQDENGSLNGFLSMRTDVGGRLKFKRSRFTLDPNNFTLTNFSEATMSKKGADRAAPGIATQINLKEISDVEYVAGKKFTIRYKNKADRFKAKSEKEAQLWVTNLNELVIKAKANVKTYSPVRLTAADIKNGPGKKTGRIPRKINQPTTVKVPQPKYNITGSTRTGFNQQDLDHYRPKQNKGRGLNKKKSQNELHLWKLEKTAAGFAKESFENDGNEDDDILPPPPPMPEELQQPQLIKRKVIKPDTNYRRPTYQFNIQNKTLIVPSNAHGGTRQTHGKLTKLGTGASLTRTNNNNEKVAKVHNRKVVRQQTRREKEGENEFKDKSEATIQLLYDTLGLGSSLASKLFTNLDEEAVTQMVNEMYRVPIKPGEKILEQNEQNNKFYIIESGKVEFFNKPKLRREDKNELSIFFEGSSHSLMLRNSVNDLKLRGSLAEIPIRKAGGSMISAPLINPKGSFELGSADKFIETSRTDPRKNKKGKIGKPQKLKAKPKKKSFVIGEDISLGVNSTGVYFGELSLLYEDPSNVTVIARTNGVLWAIDRKTFHKISTEASQRQRKEKLGMVSSTSTFSDILNDKQLASLTEAVEYKVYKDGDTVLGFEEKIGKIFWIKKGKVALYDEHIIDFKQTEAEPVINFQENESYGEVALLENCKSDFHFISNGGTIVFELDIEEAQDIVGSVKECLKRKLEGNNSSSNIVNQMSIINESGMTLLQTAVDKIKMTIRTRMTTRLTTETANLSADDRTTDRTARHTFLNPIDVSYIKVPPVIKNIKLSDLCPVSLLGSGCFGTVHLVKNCKEGKVKVKDCRGARQETINFFALKIVLRQNEEDSKWQSGLDNELQAWAETSYLSASPFVAKLYHSYADDGVVFFLAEYCCGGNLFEAVQQVPARRFEPMEVKQFYLANVLLGLEAIHERSIIFRDLKPENILIGVDGYVKITDFGLCKKSYRTFTVCGTPDYIAPEVVLSRGHDSASDFWALGVLLFELSVGQAPFPGRDAMDKYEAVLAHETGKFPGMDKNRVEIFTDLDKYEERVNNLSNPIVEELREDIASNYSEEEDEDDDLPDDVVYVQKYAWNLINRLIEPKKTKRIGVLASGFDGIKQHDFFGDFDWEKCEKMKISAPIVPDITEEAMLEELEDDDLEEYIMDFKDVEEDDSEYQPKVDTIINGRATFAELFLDDL